MHFLIIGVGSIGERHLRNFLRIDDVVCSIAEVNEDLCSYIVSKYRVEHAYRDYRDADLSVFDGVVICVPANLHVPIAIDVVSASTHVLSEKPLAMSLDRIDELKYLRDDHGVVAMVGFTFRSNPLIVELKQRVDSSDFGKVHVVNLYVGQNWPDMRVPYPPAYAQKRETGGGTIPDMLVHTINYLEWIFGLPLQVSAHHWHMVLNDIDTEDLAFVTLRFAADTIAQLGCCMFQRDNTSRLTFVCDRGTMQMRLGCDTLELYDASKDTWTKGTAADSGRDDHFHDQARHFMDCILGRATPRCTIEEAEQTLHTVLAALESADGDGRFVDTPQLARK